MTFLGYCICSNQLLHHFACLQFSSLALVLSCGITGALKVFFSSREQTTLILMLFYEHWGFLSFYISHSLPQKRRSFSKYREGCRPASLLGESSEKDPWDFQSPSFLLSSGGLWRDDFGFFPFRLLLNSISSPPNDFSICISNGWGLTLPAPCFSSGYWLPPQATLWISPSPRSFNSSFTWGCSYLQLMVWELNKATVVQWWVKGRLGESWSVLLISFTLGCHNLLYFLLFFSVAVLLIYQMVQMFWHNYFSLHYLFMMLFVIVFYTFEIINYVHVKISISKKSVTRGQKTSWFIFSQNLFPVYWIGWFF